MWRLGIRNEGLGIDGMVFLCRVGCAIAHQNLSFIFKSSTNKMGLKSQPPFNKSIAQQCLLKLFTIHYSLFTQDEDFQ